MIAKIVAEARMLTFRPVNFVNYSQKVSWSCASIFRYALVCSRLTRDRERALITEVANIATCTFPIRQLGYVFSENSLQGLINARILYIIYLDIN